MPTVSILGGATFNDPRYKDHINQFYFPLDNMKRSVAILKAAANHIDIKTMEFGQYQPVLSPLYMWPNGKGKHWWREMGRARIDLAAQSNASSLSKDEPGVTPMTKCCLLDAAIRKCFNSDPDPIPMLIDVEEQPHDSPNANTHDIKVVWEYDGPSDVPTLLRLTMICPFRAP